MNDRPTPTELIAAARHYLETELIPTLSDQRLRFQTLVAANVLAIAERDLASEEDRLVAEWRWLADLLHLDSPPPERLTALKATVRDANQRLCASIRRGDFDAPPRFTALAKELRRRVEEKLEIANPRYLASFRTTRTVS